MRKILPLLIVSVALTFAPVAHATGVLVNVKDTVLYGDTTMITLQVLNNSQKDVSAYSIKITVTFANGATRIVRQDFERLGLVLSNAQDVHFHPGGMDEEYAAVLAIPGNPIYKVEAVADVVIYADRTAQVEDEDSFNRLVTIRASMAQGKRLAINAIDQALADPINPNVLHDTIATLQPRLDAQIRTHASDLVATHGLGPVLSVLQSMKPQAELGRDAKNLRDYSDRLHKDADAFEQHSKITRVK